MQLTQANLVDLYRTYRIMYDQALQGAKPTWPRFCTEVPSGSIEQVHAWLAALPSMREWMGTLVRRFMGVNRYSIVNREYYDTVEVPRQDVETDQHGIYGSAFAALGDAAGYHPDQLTAMMLMGGFDANALDYTGSPFFSADKPLDPDGKVVFTNSGTDPLTRASFRAARAALLSRTNAEGRSMGLGRKLQLIVPPALGPTARDIVEGETINLNATFDGTGKLTGLSGGGTNVDRSAAELVEWAPLAPYSETAWFLIESGFIIKPFAHQINLKTTLRGIVNPESEWVMEHETFLYKAYGRYAVGYLLPELAFGSLGTGGDSAKQKSALAKARQALNEAATQPKAVVNTAKAEKDLKS